MTGGFDQYLTGTTLDHVGVDLRGRGVRRPTARRPGRAWPGHRPPGRSRSAGGSTLPQLIGYSQAHDQLEPPAGAVGLRGGPVDGRDRRRRIRRSRRRRHRALRHGPRSRSPPDGITGAAQAMAPSVAPGGHRPVGHCHVRASGPSSWTSPHRAACRIGDGGSPRARLPGPRWSGPRRSGPRRTDQPPEGGGHRGPQGVEVVAALEEDDQPSRFGGIAGHRSRPARRSRRPTGPDRPAGRHGGRRSRPTPVPR